MVSSYADGVLEAACGSVAGMEQASCVGRVRFSPSSSLSTRLISFAGAWRRPLRFVLLHGTALLHPCQANMGASNPWSREKAAIKRSIQKAASSSRLRSRPTLLSRVRAAERDRVGRRAKSSPSPLPRRPRGPAVAGRRSLLPPHPPPYPPPPHRLPQPLPLPPHSAAASAAAVFLRPRRPRRPRRALQRARSHAQVGKTSGAHAHAAPEGRLFGTGGRPAQTGTWHSGKTLQEKNFTRKPW